MAITLELPPEVEARLREDIPDLEYEARLALALELYRKEAIGVFGFGKMLGMNRFEAEAFLARRKEYAQCLTKEEVWEDYQRLNRLLGDEAR